jgi:site-specific recombinase XerD
VHAPWSSTIAETFQTLLGTDRLRVTAITMLSNSLASSTYANYDSALRQFFAFCKEENISPLQATPATMLRYTAWLGMLGTLAADSLQPYFSVVNKFSVATSANPSR